MAEFAVVETWSKSVSSSPRPPPCAPFYFVRFPPMGCHSPSWKRVFPFSYSSVEISQPPPEVYLTNLFQIQSHWQSGLTILQVNDVPLGIFQATSLGSSSPYPTTSFPVFIHGQRRIVGNRAKLIGRYSLLYSLKFWNTSWGGKEHRSTSMVRTGRLFYQNVGS